MTADASSQPSLPATDTATPDDLLDWAAAYARSVVAAADLDVDLSLVEWEISKRAKRRAGAVIAPDFPDASVGDPYDWATIPQSRRKCTVRLTWQAYKELGAEAMAGTVRHELVHVAQFQRYGATDHGDDFERRADRLDAPLTCRSFATPKYILECGSCGERVAHRFRRSSVVDNPERYRSGCCSAPLESRANPAGKK